MDYLEAMQMLHDTPVHTYTMKLAIEEAYNMMKCPTASEIEEVEKLINYHKQLQAKTLSKGVF